MSQRISLTERLECAWEEWNAAIAGLDDADFKLPVYRQWDLKDILGHVYSYLEFTLRRVRSYKKSKRLASPRAPSYSFFNRREAARLKPVPLAQLRADLGRTYRELNALVPTLNDDDLKRKFPAPWQKSTYQTTLRSILREEAVHLQIHANDVRLWRERERIGK